MPTPRKHAHPAARQAAYRARVAAAPVQEQAAKGMPPRPAIASLPGHRRWTALIRHAALLLQTVQEEMEAYAAERSDIWQEGPAGEAFSERLEAVQEAQAVVAELGG